MMTQLGMECAFITGASAGIGFEFAKLFAADGIHCVLVARRKDKLEELKTKLLAINKKINVEVLALDLRDPKSHLQAKEFIKSRGLFVRFLVNNAGYGQAEDFVKLSLEEQLGQIDLNIRALVALSHAFLPEMLRHPEGGRILNVGSTAGFQPGPHMAIYYATKAFVNSFSFALSEELRGTSVSVTLSCPGPTQSEFADIAGLQKKRLFQMTVMTSELVARQAYKAMHKGQWRVIHGIQNLVSAQLTAFVPTKALTKIAGFLNSPK